MKVSAIVAILALALSGSPVWAQEGDPDGARNFKVNVSVTGEAGEAKGRLYDCLEETLGSGDDIDVVMDGTHDYVIFVMVGEMDSGEGRKIIVAPDYVTRLRKPRMIMEKVDEKYRDTYEDLFSMLYFYPKRSLFTVAEGEETLACEQIVDQFTAGVLRMTRRLQPGGRPLRPIH